VAPRVTRVVVHACPEPRRVHLAGLRLPQGDGPPGWRHAAGRLEVRFADAGEGHTLEVEPAP
jgi:hypothetical protein